MAACSVTDRQTDLFRQVLGVEFLLSDSLHAGRHIDAGDMASSSHHSGQVNQAVAGAIANLQHTLTRLQFQRFFASLGARCSLESAIRS